MDLDLIMRFITGLVDKSKLSKAEVEQIDEALILMKAKFISPEQQKKNKAKATEKANKDAFKAAKIQDGKTPKAPKDAEVVDFAAAKKKLSKEEMDKNIGMEPQQPMMMSEEVVKIDDRGQWKIEKAIKPGPSLDYSKFNSSPSKKDYKQMEAKASTIDYSDKKNVEVKKPWSGAAARSKKIKDKIDTSPKTALETFRSRGQTPKKD
jgi:hypothetical protein